jgi:hypothetical protein
MIEVAAPQVPRPELQQKLELLLSEHFGTPRRICWLRRRRSRYASSYIIENLEVELDRGKHLRLIFKNMSADSLLATARRVRPEFLYRPEREIEIYLSVLDPKQFGTATCYGAIEVPELERYWLFLERINGPLLWQVGRIEQWCRAARWLAQLHSHFRRTRPESPKLPKCLLQYDETHYRRWIERALGSVERSQQPLSKDLKTKFKRLGRSYDRVVTRLLSVAKTLIHGEFYPSNVILRAQGNGKRICPIDWEVAAIGPGVIDLAALTSGKWSLDQKRILVQAYHSALGPEPGGGPSIQELLELVDYCQIHLAVQWLGWASDWSPPQSHAQDWLAEAVALSERWRIIE